jgi:hypothetical protein
VLFVGKGRTVRLSVAVIITVLAVFISSSVVYFMQQQTFQSSIQGLKAQNEQLTLEVNSLKKDSSGLNNERRVVIQEKADRILLAMKNKDMNALSSFVHPQKGLRFSPYTNINTSTDLIFPVASISNLFSNNTIYNWGKYDGSGNPIDLIFNDYYAKFIYDKDFLAAPQISFNEVLQRGNMINNIATVYPQGVTIEYYFPGFEQQYKGMDWESLKLVFEQSGTDWYLVGIIHEQWTI